ncbi:MAG: HlyD family efflux transporter periplasmic adaptor subunit [Ferruginibacter sp.]
MKKLSFIIAVVIFASCNNSKENYDASGTFESVETIISSEANGIILAFNIQEGQQLSIGDSVGYIDSVQLYLKKKQLEAQIKATGSRLPDVAVQTGFYNQQGAVTQSRLNNLLHEQNRIQNLVSADAATKKQLDDINAQIDETKKQLQVINEQQSAQVSTLETQKSGLRAEALPLYVQIEQINDQLARCRIINPVKGIVLSKYAEVNEMTSMGKPLYKVADLSTIILRAYVTGNQFANIKLQQKVTTMVDDGTGKYKQYDGVIEWISDKAEFTPKTIQTKDERANLVYAIKIRVQNDGYLKIGMYGEVKF